MCRDRSSEWNQYSHTHIRKGGVALGLSSILVYHFIKNGAPHVYVRVSQMENQLQTCSGLPMSSWCDVLCFTCLTERHRNHLFQNGVGIYWHCWKNIALLLKFLYIGSDAREEIHVHMQRVKIVKVRTEEAEVRKSTSLHNSLACSEYPSTSGIQCFVFVGSKHWFPEAT